MLERPDHPHDAFSWMDVLRTSAAVLVAVSHVRDILWRDALPSDPFVWKGFFLLTGFGHIGVVVFFVLSGFWITRSVMKRIDQPRFWSNYLIDRVSRLWIVLIPVLIIGGALDWVGVTWWQTANYTATSGMHSLSHPVADSLGLTEAIGSLLFLSKISVLPLGSNGPLWSLAYEFWYYLWFPALAFFAFRRKVSLPLAAVGLAFISGDLVFGFLSWLMGSALHFILQRYEKNPRLPWERILFIASFLIFLVLLFTARVVQKAWIDPMLAASFAFFLLGMCRVNLRFPVLLQPIATFGSGSSFSLYALHFPLAMAITAWLTAGVRQEPSLILFGQTMGIMAFLLVAAFVFSRLTETNTDVLRQALKRMLIPVGRTSQPSTAASADNV